ncbi:MAG: dienelactone hydrolase family protein, partial [Anaerolineae bacterium]
MDRIYVMELVRSFQCGLLTRRAFLTQATAALGSATAAGALLAACGPSPTPTRPVVVQPAATAAPAATATAAAGPTQGAGMASPGALAAGQVEYPHPGGQTLTGYLARPDRAGPLPAVVVIQEWWGLNEHIKDVTRRLAGEGFVALAPDLYHGAVVSEPDEARKLVMELDMDEAVREIRHAIDFLLSQEYVAGP